MFTTTTDTSPDSLYIFCEMKTDYKVSVLFEIRGGVVVPESRDREFAGRVQWDKDVLRDGRLRLHVSRLRTEDSGLYMCDVRTNYGVDFSECWLNVSGKLVEKKSVELYEQVQFNSFFWMSVWSWRKVLRATTIYSPSLHSHSIWTWNISETCHNFSCSVVWSFTAARDWPKPEIPVTDTQERPNTASREWIVVCCVLGLAVGVLLLVCRHLFIHCLSKRPNSSRGFQNSTGPEETTLSPL